MKIIQGFIIASFVIFTMMISIPLATAQGMYASNASPILSPLKQFQHGTSLQNIQCQTGLILAMNIHRSTPACLRQSTLDKLANRGWVPVIPQVTMANQTEQQMQMLGKIIILQDNGTTIQLNKGDTFLLRLGDSYGWKWNIDNPTVVGPYRGHIGYMLVRGAQGIFEAYNTGNAVLTADGTPTCLSLPPNNQASPCNTSTVHFRLDINVS